MKSHPMCCPHTVILRLRSAFPATKAQCMVQGSCLCNRWVLLSHVTGHTLNFGRFQAASSRTKRYPCHPSFRFFPRLFFEQHIRGNPNAVHSSGWKPQRSSASLDLSSSRPLPPPTRWTLGSPREWCKTETVYNTRQRSPPRQVPVPSE